MEERRIEDVDVANFILGILLCFLLFISVSCYFWQVNNPKAKADTCWTHFWDVITFKKLQEFQ